MHRQHSHRHQLSSHRTCLDTSQVSFANPPHAQLMEDPWANAWGEPSKPTLHDRPTQAVASGSSSWVAPSVSAIQGDNEDDLSTPAWSFKPTTSWGNPDIAETTLWGSDASAGWNPAPSTFDRISLSSKDSMPENESTSVESTPQERQDSAASSSATDEEEPRFVTTPPRAGSTETSPKPLSRSPIVPPLSLPPIDDIDGFGTFETAVDNAEEWGTPPKATFVLPSADALVWGAQPWEAPDSGAEIADTKDEEDEWETARQQKEKQDQHVPPELLAGMLHQFEELSAELWPEGEPSAENEHDKVRIVDMEKLGLNAVIQRLVPEDLVLPPIVSFPKTFTSKQLSEALKLTRHSHLTRTSPIALYMASKGSTSWEASIKAKPNIIPDDITPAGWKILESNKDDSPASEDVKKKPSGGLLSFFGRRGTASDTAKRSASPVSNSAASSLKTTASPRVSVDSSRASTSQSVKTGRSTPSSPSVATFVANTNQATESKTVPESYGNPSKDPMDAIVREPTPLPPSAVSRFLGRFSSRSKASSRDSHALSSNDIEFLSDVPSLHSPETDQNTSSLDALSMMLKSPPLPTALPPPLAPPPKAPPKPRISLPPPPSSRPAQNDDFMSFFDTLGDSAQAQGPSQSDSAFSLLTTPPVKPSLARVPSSSALPTPIPTPSIPTLTIGNPDRPSDQTPRQTRISEDQSWPSFDYPSAPTPSPASMSKFPPPPQNKRTFVPIMSSSRPPSTAPLPLLPKPTSSFALPPPSAVNSRAASTVDLLSGTSSVISPGSRSHTPLRVQQPVQPPTQSININDDDDDFSDFLSSPAQTTNPGYTPFSNFAAATTVADPPEPPISTVQTAAFASDTFDDFDDFLDPPPQPPAKSASFTSNSATPSTRSSKRHTAAAIPKDPHTGLVRKVSKNDHNRTLSLLSTAAARGRWLNPPSPLPEALKPPPSNKNSSYIDLFGSGGGSMQTQQEEAVASLTTSRSSPAAFPNNTITNGTTDKPLPSWNFPLPMQATPLKPSFPLPGATYVVSTQQPMLQPSQHSGTAISSGTKSGGLSAQDLSFFEGL